MEMPDELRLPMPDVPATSSSPLPRRGCSYGAGAFEIVGAGPLFGEVTIGGGKNAALPILAAAILASEPVWIRNIPALADVAMLLKVLNELGIAAYSGGDGTLCLETRDSRPVTASSGLIRKMRAGVCVLGPLLARRGRAEIPLPGGCAIGDRPIDLHLSGLQRMGATFFSRNGVVVAEARRLRGAVVSLRGPRGTSVTGTANLLMAATLAEGTTTLLHAAKEPEIVDLGRFLIAMGAKIEGLGSSTLRVRGGKRLAGCDYAILPDRIEAATFLLAGAITRGRVRAVGARSLHLTAILENLTKAGVSCEADDRGVTVGTSGPLRPVSVAAAPYPEVPTDIQAMWTALMSLSSGKSLVRDRVFPDRFGHVSELRRLGANITRTKRGASIHGPARLSGAEVVTTDLRAGAALVLAGLAAEGRTRILGIEQLDRGYELLDEKLAILGASIRRVSVAPF